jgi:DNA polymerase-4
LDERAHGWRDAEVAADAAAARFGASAVRPASLLRAGVAAADQQRDAGA